MQNKILLCLASYKTIATFSDIVLLFPYKDLWLQNHFGWKLTAFSSLLNDILFYLKSSNSNSYKREKNYFCKFTEHKVEEISLRQFKSKLGRDMSSDRNLHDIAWFLSPRWEKWYMWYINIHFLLLIPDVLSNGLNSLLLHGPLISLCSLKDTNHMTQFKLARLPKWNLRQQKVRLAANKKHCSSC